MLISQIAGLIIVMLVFNLSVKRDESAYKLLLSYLNQELFTVRDIAETVKNYFSSDNSWAVSGDNVTLYTSENQDTSEKATEKTRSMFLPIITVK